MAIAIVLLLVLVASILFHFAGPWVLPELASNWGDIDLTIGITLVVTGLVFIAVILFTVYAIIKFRYRADRTAAYEPENKKLELWLTGLSSVGIVAMLAPGLYVYSKVVDVPTNALPIEALAKQWTWAFRLPGNDGILGKTDISLIGVGNPFGIDPLDPNGQDDKLVAQPVLHLPLDQPIEAKLRSIDVLHNFYVPEFRNKIDAVPGIVSSFWFTPTREGEFEILCAEYCGVGHYNMRGKVMVQARGEFDQWLASQPTFAEAQANLATSSLSPLAKEGEKLSQAKGCMGCHGFEASPLGPSWKGLYGKTETFTDGTSVVVDEIYLKVAIVDPAKTIVSGYTNVMPPYPLSDDELNAIIAYIREQGGEAGQGVAAPDAGEEQPEAEVEEPAPDAAAGPLDGLGVAQAKGCLACHSTGTDKMLGPAWQGLFGSERTLTDGRTVVADAEYLRRALVAPADDLVEGYPPVMPAVPLTEEEIQALLEYLERLSQ